MKNREKYNKSIGHTNFGNKHSENTVLKAIETRNKNMGIPSNNKSMNAAVKSAVNAVVNAKNAKEANKVVNAVLNANTVKEVNTVVNNALKNQGAMKNIGNGLKDIGKGVGKTTISVLKAPQKIVTNMIKKNSKVANVKNVDVDVDVDVDEDVEENVKENVSGYYKNKYAKYPFESQKKQIQRYEKTKISEI